MEKMDLTVGKLSLYQGKKRFRLASKTECGAASLHGGVELKTYLASSTELIKFICHPNEFRKMNLG